MLNYNFQNCQKLVVFSKDDSQVLLCKRKGENDYDGVFSFIGGKMEVTDKDLIAGMQREKNEEVGKDFKIKVYPTFNAMAFFRKKSGDAMVLPHYYCQYISGQIKLNEEYSKYKWVPIKELEKFEPKIETIVPMVQRLLRLKKIMTEEEFVEV